MKTILLLPVLLIWAIILRIRNALYDFNVLSSYSFEDSPKTISIGNLNVGGTGKSPHIEYIIRILNSKLRTDKEPQVATLSRGYKRKSKGFKLANFQSTATEIGDEPLQFFKKFQNIIVAVDERRVRGVKNLKKLFPSIKVVLLDDAFQHRKIKPGLSILLTNYSKPYTEDNLFPIGNLREPAYASQRADIIIVSKSSKYISPLEKRIIREKLNPKPYQSIYFSFIQYQMPRALNEVDKFSNEINLKQTKPSVLLITGIAKPEPLLEYLKDKTNSINHVKFPDHHSYSAKDIEKINLEFEQIYEGNKIILTTEKDAMRLKNSELTPSLLPLPIYYIPIEVKLGEKDTEELNKQILNYVREDKIDSEVYKRTN